MPEQQRPIILLDVDGVINCGEKFKTEEERLECKLEWRVPNDAITRWPDMKWLPVNVPRHWPSCYGGDSNEHTLFVNYSPTVIERVNRWAAKADIIWMTMWGDDAPQRLAPVLGLETFGTPPHFKRQYMNGCSDLFDTLCPKGRRVIYIDDQLGEWGRGGRSAIGDDTASWMPARPDTLLIHPALDFGLSETHLDLVDRALEDWDSVMAPFDPLLFPPYDKSNASQRRLVLECVADQIDGYTDLVPDRDAFIRRYDDSQNDLSLVDLFLDEFMADMAFLQSALKHRDMSEMDDEEDEVAPQDPLLERKYEWARRRIMTKMETRTNQARDDLFCTDDRHARFHLTAELTAELQVLLKSTPPPSSPPTPANSLPQ